MPRREYHYRNRRPAKKHTSKDKSRITEKKLCLLLWSCMREKNNTRTSDISLSKVARAVESVKEGVKDDGMCSASSTWRLTPLKTQATRLYCQKFV